MPKNYLLTLIILCSVSSNAQRLVKEFSPGKGSCYINHMGNLDSGFVFASYRTEFGLEPWISDGTEKGTRLIKDLFPGTTESETHHKIAIE